MGMTGVGARERRQERMEETCRKGREDAMGELRRAADEMGCALTERLQEAVGREKGPAQVAIFKVLREMEGKGKGGGRS